MDKQINVKHKVSHDRTAILLSKLGARDFFVEEEPEYYGSGRTDLDFENDFDLEETVS